MNRTPLTQDQIEARLTQLDGWKLSNEKLTKTFMFEDFKQAWAFMNQVALKAEQMDHHPEWFNVYNKVNVELATHDPKGISELDFTLAAFMDDRA